MAEDLSKEEILERINLADRWLKKFRDSDHQASSRYIDANAPAMGSDDDWDLSDDAVEPEADVPDAIPIGQPNYLTINNETKMAAIAMGSPALHVKANEDPNNGGIPNAGEIVNKAWEQAWDNGNWKRETQAGLQKLGICGLGVLWYRWDAVYGPCFEHIPSKRLLLDPHATNLLQLEYGGVKVKMSLRKARRLYDPNGENEYFEPNDGDKNIDKSVITIRIYFDRQNEVHEYNGKIVFKDKNLYGELKSVPIIPLEGFIDPRDRLLPLGDNVFAAGLNQQVVDLSAIMSSMAKHGGPITLGDSNFFNEATKEAIQKGTQQQIIFGKSPINPQALPLHRIAAEQPSPAWAPALQSARTTLDGIQGSSPGQRGEMIQNVTATQAAAVEQKSGARPTQARADYETWITRMARAFVWMIVKFGGPTEEDPGTEETRTVWKAFKQVSDVKVVEGSSSFQSPSNDKQGTLQLYTTLAQSMPMWIQLVQSQATDKLPNMEQIANDVYRAFSRQNIEQYWKPAPPPPQNPEPSPDLIKALQTIYKDANPDIRRQIETDFKLQPSQLEDPVEDGGEGAVDTGKTPHELEAEAAARAADRLHEKQTQAVDHQHELQLKAMDIAAQEQKTQAENARTAVQLDHQAQLAKQQTESQHELAEKNNEAKVEQIKAKPAPAKPKAKPK